MKQPQKLTGRQALVLDTITEYIQAAGFPPTIREIGDRVGISSTNGVNDHLKALERKGYIVRLDSKSRALRALYRSNGQPFEQGQGNAQNGKGGRAVASGSSVHSVEPVASDEVNVLQGVYDIPVVGRIAAGIPISAIEHTEEFVKIGEGLLGRVDDVFSLRVQGDSMIDDGIFDGDYIFVKKQRDIRDGEIVAAMIDGEATVKRIFKEGSRVRLQPANKAMEPIFIQEADAREAAVLGRVVGVFRRV